MVVQTFFFVHYNPYPVNAPQCSVDENVRFHWGRWAYCWITPKKFVFNFDIVKYEYLYLMS